RSCWKRARTRRTSRVASRLVTNGDSISWISGMANGGLKWLSPVSTRLQSDPSESLRRQWPGGRTLRNLFRTDRANYSKMLIRLVPIQTLVCLELLRKAGAQLGIVRPEQIEERPGELVVLDPLEPHQVAGLLQQIGLVEIGAVKQHIEQVLDLLGHF